jgi:hypothetical protein
MLRIFLTAILVLTVTACANRPESIPASYTSHEKYTMLDCTQLATQLGDARSQLGNFSSKQNSKATGDAWGVFLILVPVSKLSGDYEGDVAKWKGEVAAIETAQVINECKSA